MGASTFQFLGADPERINGSVHGYVGETPRLGYAFTEPDDARKRIHHPEAAARRACEQKTAIVRAEV
jgi:hypothetical protein